MFMESSEEVAVAVVSYSSNGSSGVECDYAAAVASFAKRKRTKRLRTSSSPPSPPPPPPPPPNEEDYFSTSTTTEEEEDMAHCLILLAQGRSTAAASPTPPLPLPPREEKFTSRKFAETTTTATGAKAGFYVYECKTCNKCFPSFQALGGHRASHKKPKLAVAAAVEADVEHDGLEISMNSSFAKTASTAPPPPPAPAPPNKLRVHECSICGSEFASGQALGGHMRRHRPVGPVPAAAESPELLANYSSTKKKEEEEEKCMMLSLDLNLPAPSEENAMAVAFAGFTVDQRPLALVDCHY